MGRKRQTNRHLPERMYLKSGGYYYVYFNKWHNLGRTYSRAMAEYAKLTDPSGPCRTISDLLDRYLKEIAPLKAEATYKSNINESKFLRAGLGHFLVDDLTKKDIYQYMDIRGQKSKTRSNRELALLSHVYTKAIRWGAAESNPCLGVERYKESPRDRYVEDWEYIAFRDFAGELISSYLDFKLLTGLRKGDILKIRLDQLKEDGIHVNISKTKKDIIIEWSQNLRYAVDRIRKLKRPITGMYLFCTGKGQPYSESGFSSIWQRKMKAALEQGILKERFRDHDIRAKTSSDTNLEHASKLLGHSDQKITQRHYRRKDEKVKPLS